VAGCGLYIYPRELTPFWVRRAVKSGVSFLSIHPAGGQKSHAAIDDAVLWLKRPRTREMLNELNENGVDIEYGMHALTWLLPRALFTKNPEWFRMDEHGARTPDFNMCAGSGEALSYVAGRAAELTVIFRPTTNFYHFWPDDIVNKRCRCECCAALTVSDYLLKINHALLDGIRRSDSNGKQSYLAYLDALAPPSAVAPRPGIYLEYAPFDRDMDRPIDDADSAANAAQTKPLVPLLDCFGRTDARVLDYWLDNSKLSGWKTPMKRFELKPGIVKKDAAYYKSLGFETLSCFACFLGEDYYKLYGEAPDLDVFMAAAGG